VRALVFAEDERRLPIVSADFLGFPALLGNKARARLIHSAGELLIGATHTHSAPDCYGFPDEKGASTADLKYLESVCAKMAEAVTGGEQSTASRPEIATG